MGIPSSLPEQWFFFSGDFFPSHVTRVESVTSSIQGPRVAMGKGILHKFDDISSCCVIQITGRIYKGRYCARSKELIIVSIHRGDIYWHIRLGRRMTCYGNPLGEAPWFTNSLSNGSLPVPWGMYCLIWHLLCHKIGDWDLRLSDCLDPCIIPRHARERDSCRGLGESPGKV